LAYGGVIVGLVAVGSALVFIFWIAMAIPTSVIASRIGHPRWIAYVVWCPAWANILAYIHHSLGPLAILFWVPGVVYLWLLVFGKGAKTQAAR
jgi:hypothetical protein